MSVNFFSHNFKDIMSKDNRKKVYKYLKDYVETMEGYHTDEERDDILLYLMYEIHTEWVSVPKLEDIFLFIKKKKMGYNHDQFLSIKSCFQEEEDFIINPPVIEEGVIECKKCKSKRTFSFNKQTRSSDEAVTVFVRCVDCKTQFRM